MNRASFRLLLLAIVIVGIWIGRQQQTLLQGAREALVRPVEPILATSPPPSDVPTRPGPPHPSLELMKRRAEATRLREELDATTPQAQSVARAAEEWAHVWEGVRPSQQPGFVFFTNIVPSGFATPGAAFASFQHGMRNQSVEPLTSTRMKDLWDVPDDFDDPHARYSIDVGQGIGGEIGFLILKEEPVDPHQVRLLLEMENPDGSSFRQERILIQRDGRWRMKPVSLQRLPNLPAK